MKKLLLLSIILSFVGILIAQNSPHWTFAKCFGGMEDGMIQNPNNAPHHMEMDSHGNVYIFGAYGQMMRIDDNLLPTAAGSDNTRGSFLAKFNCNGELQWTKAVKCQQFDANANWMQIKNDTIYIMGDVRFKEPYNTYFLDTILYASALEWPYTFPWIDYKYYNYFSKLDVNGNIVSTKFLQKGSYYGCFWDHAHSIRYAPFHISESSYYLLGNYHYIPYENYNYQYYVDTVPITDTVYFDFGYNIILFKFNANMEIQWHKPIIDSVYNATKFRLNFFDMVADAEDNMYYVGTAQLTYNDSTSQENPAGTMYLADGHTIEFQEHGLDVGFIMKIDTSGTIQWVKQMYRATNTDAGGSSFTSIAIDEESGTLYISGQGSAINYQSVNYYSIFPNGDIFEAPCYDCSGTNMASYILAMNKETGDVLWHTSPYTEGSDRYIGNINYENDSLYVGLRWGVALHFGDTVYMHDGSKYYITLGFSHLTYNTAGELCSVRNLRTDNGFDVYAYDTKVDAAGNIWFAGLMDADLAFGEDTSLLVSSSNIFLARYGKECPEYIDSTAVLCYGESISVGEQQYASSGTYQAFIESPGGDTIVNLDLNILPVISSGLPSDTTVCLNNTFTLTAASGYDTYLWHDGTIGQTYSKTYLSAAIDTLSVIIGKTYQSPQGDMYCEWTDTIIVNADVCQGYKLQQQAKLSVYPNPASGQIVLEYPNIESAILQIYDNTGRLLSSKNITGSGCKINISHLNTGIYYIVLKSKNYNLTEKLFVE
ncbi:MAG: T9SS type A sorting domain-containing protein [Bacteroidales bacterium]|nr:T9SS type A sorting domain-containing protein [Bacteroidales bacterium]